MAASGRVLRLTPLAEIDLQYIWNYTADVWSPEQADRYIADMRGAFSALAAGKQKGRLVPAREGYLKYAAGSHLIFYRETQTTVDVIRVLHQRMDTERYL